MQNNNEKLVKNSVMIIISLIIIIFFVICLKSGFLLGSAIGELIYNLKHQLRNRIVNILELI